MKIAESYIDHKLEVLLFPKPLSNKDPNKRQLTKLWGDTAHD